MNWWRRITGQPELPDGFTGKLDGSERVLASAATSDGGHLVVTSLGLWICEPAGDRRIGWHLVSTARWDGRMLHLVEADEIDTVGDAVLLTDRAPRRFRLPAPGHVPELVRKRVTRSVLTSERRDLAGGSALFVRRQVPGRDGAQLQIRVDPGTDVDAVRRALG